jgi:hypothetical protein
LAISSSYSSPGFLSPIGAPQPDPDLIANASWGNVQATAQGPPGTAPPSSIRLEFQVIYTPQDQLSRFGFGAAGVTAQNLLVNGLPMTLTSAGTRLQSGMAPVVALPNGLLSGSFSMDLPLTTAGKSGLLSLELSYNPLNLFDATASTISQSMLLRLTGILLPDGQPILSEGYNVTFDSGLPSPPLPPAGTAPEPSTVAIWSALVVCGALMRRRKTRLER